jgi:hypothetical protein
MYETLVLVEEGGAKEKDAHMVGPVVGWKSLAAMEPEDYRTEEHCGELLRPALQDHIDPCVVM